MTSGSAESSSGVQGSFSEGITQSVSAGWSRSWTRSKGQETPAMESDETCGLLLDTIKACIDREKEGSRNVGERISYGISGGKGEEEVRLSFSVDVPLKDLPEGLQNLITGKTEL